MISAASYAAIHRRTPSHVEPPVSTCAERPWRTRSSSGPDMAVGVAYDAAVS
jgi:hypothetical protein